MTLPMVLMIPTLAVALTSGWKYFHGILTRPADLPAPEWTVEETAEAGVFTVRPVPQP